MNKNIIIDAKLSKQIVNCGETFSISVSIISNDYLSLYKHSELNSRCHVKKLPKGLFESACERVCGEFLYLLKTTGKLEEFDLEQAVSSVKVGDTSVNFSGTSSDEAFNVMLNRLRWRGAD